jgi:hypothetical protein
MATDDKLAAMKAASKAEGSEEQQDRPETWKPEPGDMLAGTLVKGDRVMTQNGDARLMVIHDEETDKNWTVWCSGKMLRDAVIEKAPALGSLIVVEFHGKFPVQSNPSYSFNKYSVIVDETDFEYWDKIEARYRRKAQANESSARVESFNGSDDDELSAPF